MPTFLAPVSTVGSPAAISATSGNISLGVGGGFLSKLLTASAGSWIVGSSLTGDAAYRFNIRADGRLEWADGTAANDTNLYRSAAGVLRTDTGFRVGVETSNVPTTARAVVTDVFRDQFNWPTLMVMSSDAAAIDKGGSISMGGYYTAGNSTPFARILGAKADAVDGNTGGYLSLWTRPTGGNMTERLRIAQDGATTIAATLAVGTNPATAGVLRLQNNAWIAARNAANTADVNMFTINASDQLLLGTVGGLNANGQPLYNSSYVAVAGLTGAASASRYVGATASGKPTTGSFAIGDVVIDRTGKIWINTASGSPGTFIDACSQPPYFSLARWDVD